MPLLRQPKVVETSAELIDAINAHKDAMHMSAHAVAQIAERSSDGQLTTPYGAKVLNHPNKAPRFDTLALLAAAAGLEIVVRPAP